ncbi:hypothetical protein LINGRAHAP2_LOCUS14925 [Linum grandiflorum]
MICFTTSLATPKSGRSTIYTAKKVLRRSIPPHRTTSLPAIRNSGSIPATPMTYSLNSSPNLEGSVIIIRAEVTIRVVVVIGITMGRVTIIVIIRKIRRLRVRWRVAWRSFIKLPGGR